MVRPVEVGYGRQRGLRHGAVRPVTVWRGLARQLGLGSVVLGWSVLGQFRMGSLWQARSVMARMVAVRQAGMVMVGWGLESFGRQGNASRVEFVYGTAGKVSHGESWSV